MWNTDKPEEWQPKRWHYWCRNSAVWRTNERSWCLATSYTSWTPVYCTSSYTHRAPSCPEIPEISQLSWNQQLSFGQNVLTWTIVMLSLHFFTSHDYVYVADVECQVMFSLVTLYCFMSNIALVTFLGLQNWSASMINIYAHRKTCISCVLTLVKPTKVSWNCPEIF